MDSIAGQADRPLYQDQVGLRITTRRLEKYDDIASLDRTLMHERKPGYSGGECHAIDYQVISHQQRLLHRAAWDCEVLEKESHYEESYDKDIRKSRNRFGNRLVVLLSSARRVR